jgi:hypothetical protein
LPPRGSRNAHQLTGRAPPPDQRWRHHVASPPLRCFVSPRTDGNVVAESRGERRLLFFWEGTRMQFGQSSRRIFREMALFKPFYWTVVSLLAPYFSLRVFFLFVSIARPRNFISHAEPDKSAVGECTLMVDIGSGSSCARCCCLAGAEIG